VDVGHRQLAWKRRRDPRVAVLERLNTRYLTRAHIPEPVDLIGRPARFPRPRPEDARHRNPVGRTPAPRRLDRGRELPLTYGPEEKHQARSRS
jgi:hypothetical protein